MLKKDIKKNSYDIAVIGGGPAGIMSAIIASDNGAKVILFDRNNKLGRKLILTGNGRCNITNANLNLRDLVLNYSNGGEFLFHAFSVFGPKETISFFEKIGVKTKIENNNRVFPESNDAEDVLDTLSKKLISNKVDIVYNSLVKDIKLKGKKIFKIILDNNEEIVAGKYIICTGGKSFSTTGSDGSMYKLLEKIGHTIVKPQPALSPIRVKESWVKEIQGISLEDVRLNVYINKKKKFFEDGEIMFTHFGITGPAVLNISGKVGEIIEKNSNDELKIGLDFFPKLNQEEIIKELEDILKRYPKRSVKNVLSFFMPDRLSEIICQYAKIEKEKIANSMSKIEKNIIAKAIKNFELTPGELLGFDQAWVTKGGVSLKEINHKTMGSSVIGNLYFAGEIIDIDGKTGGFNLQLCWSTGYLAGKSAAETK